MRITLQSKLLITSLAICTGPSALVAEDDIDLQIAAAEKTIQKAADIQEIKLLMSSMQHRVRVKEAMKKPRSRVWAE